MLIVVDEATGVPREIMNALFGNATGSDAQIILAYNPIDTDSYPYEAEKYGDWHLITISALDHPNIVEGKDIISGAVSREWITDMLPSWSYRVDSPGSDSFEWYGELWRQTPEVSARMLGEWSEMSSEGLIPKYLLEASLSTEQVLGDYYMGVDIARSGKDETVFAFFQGNKQLPFVTMRTNDTMEVAHKIKDYYEFGWNNVAIDDTGIGAGVSDMLRSYGVQFHAVNFAQSPRRYGSMYRRYANARTEMYFNALDMLKARSVVLQNDPKLFQELSSLRLLAPGPENTYLFEEKSELTKRIGRSPDRADATVLALYAKYLGSAAPRVLW
jgi:hypothetical protein